MNLSAAESTGPRPGAEARRWSSRAVLSRVTELTGLTSTGLTLAFVAVLAWLIGYVIGGMPLYLFAYGAVAVLVGSWCAGRRPLPLEARRSAVRGRLREGETISVEISLNARRRLTTIILEERFPALLGTPPRVALAAVESGESHGHAYQLTCHRRGSYQLGPLVVRWGDPFGLTERRITVCEPFEVLVHPRTEPVMARTLTRLWEDPPVRPPVSRPWPMGMEFYGMRPYQPGDDIRRIVWRAYGRTGSLLVRDAEQGVTDKLVILMDQDRARHSPGAVSESFEQGARVAASIGAHHLREGYTVTLEGTDTTLAKGLRGPSAGLSLMDSLARASVQKGTADALLDRVLPSLTADVELVLITPLLTPAAATRLRLLLNRGISVVVVALMWDEEAVDTLASAAALGVQVIEVGPNTSLTMAFRHEVGAGSR